MNTFIVLSALLAIAAAKPSVLLAGPTLYAAAPLVSQYHAQDELGQYAYGYNGGFSAKTETKSLDGVTRGAYSYVDPEGFLQTVEYTADAANGFRVAATNLPIGPVDNNVAPEPVQDTPEVAQARAEHLAVINEAKNRVAESSESALKPAPAPAPAALEAKLFTPVARIPPQLAPVVALRASEAINNPLAYSYSYVSPAYGPDITAYTPYHYSYAAPIYARAAPIAVAYNPAVPTETPEVAKARAEHLAAVAQTKARLGQ